MTFRCGRLMISRAFSLGVAVILGGSGASMVAFADGPPALEGPVSGTAPMPEAIPPGGDARAVDKPIHEALQAPGSPFRRERAPEAPPPPIVERPTEGRPAPEARWVAGYWA